MDSGKSWRAWLVIGLLAAVAVYLWIAPLAAPRGAVWGRYRLRDVFAGVPVAILLAMALAVRLSPPAHRRKVAIGLGVTVFSMLFTAIAFDLVYTFGVLGVWRSNYWLDRGHIPRQYSIADAELGFVRKPYVSWRGLSVATGEYAEYRTDRNGFRNPDRIERADIAFLGDSYTESAQIPEPSTFVRLVEAESGLQAVNLGRGAYGPNQELIVLRRYAFAYSPRIVVWQLFEGNDLTDIGEFLTWKKDPGRSVPLSRRYLNDSLIKSGIQKALGLPQRGTTPARLELTGGREQRVAIRYIPDPPKPGTVIYEELRRVLAEGQRLCRERGATLAVMVVPSMIRGLEQYVRLPDDAGLNTHSPSLGETVRGFCREAGCEYIDLENAIEREAATDNRHIYIPNDEHFDLRGHRIAADAVLAWLRTRGDLSRKAAATRAGAKKS